MVLGNVLIIIKVISVCSAVQCRKLIISNGIFISATKLQTLNGSSLVTVDVDRQTEHKCAVIK